MALRKMTASTIMGWRDGHGNTMLHLKARLGDKADLEYLLSKNYCDLEMVNEWNETPLLVARYEQPDIIEILLSYRANVNVINNRGQSPLHLAVLAKNEESVNKILKKGVNISLVNRYDESALFLAVNMNLYEIAKLLLENGADVNQKFAVTRSILSEAAYINDEAMVNLLLNYGANVNYINPDGTCPLRLAVMHADTNISHILIQQGADVNHQGGRSNDSILHHAVYYDNPAQVKLLVESNANVSIRRSFGMTPLHLATYNNPRYTDIISYLLDHGANINDPDGGGNTSLHLAVRKCSMEVLLMLLERGADINARDENGCTILHLAANNKDTKVIRKILKLTKFDVDKRDNLGYTPLHCAAQFGNFKGCDFLLSEGADINAKCKNNLSPVFLAIQARNIYAMKYLLRHDAGRHECLTDAIGDEDYEDISLILVSHLARMNCGDGISSRDLEFINEKKELQAYFEKCLEELERMHAFKVYNDITMAEIVVANSNKLAGFARNEELVKAFSVQNYPYLFPIYNEDVRIRMMEAWERQKVVLDASTVLNTIFRFNNPRHVVLEKIVSYLSHNNLTVLAADIDNVLD